MKYFAVIGVGSIGKRHLKNLKQLFPKGKTIAVASNPRQLSQVDSADICLSSIDELSQYSLALIIIASPASYHELHFQKLLSANAPILIEKPVTATLAQFESLTKALEQSDFCSKIGVGYCLRYLPSAIKLKEILEQEQLGKVYNVQVNVGDYLPNWRPNVEYQTSVSANKALGGGVLLELSHELDYLQWLFGELNLQYANLRKSGELSTDVEEIADLVFITQQDIVCNVHLDFIQKSTQRYCHLITEKGRLEWNLLTNSIVLFDEKGSHELYMEQEWDKNLMYINMLQDFYQLSHCEYFESKTHSKVAQLEPSGRIVSLIEEIKQQVRWQ